MFALKSVRLAGRARAVLRAVQFRSFADDVMPFTFAAVNKVFYDNASNIRQVDVPSFDGVFGILPKHVPMLAILKPGVITVHESDGSVKKIFVSSGTVTINEDASVQVLAEEAHPVEDLDAGVCREILSNAESQLSAASGDVARAEAEIAVEVAEALVKAVE